MIKQFEHELKTGQHCGAVVSSVAHQVNWGLGD